VGGSQKIYSFGTVRRVDRSVGAEAGGVGRLEKKGCSGLGVGVTGGGSDWAGRMVSAVLFQLIFQ